MATTGSFTTSGWSDSNAPDYYVFSWTLSSQSVSGNYSIIAWSLVAGGGKNEYWWTNVKEKYVTVNGTTQSNSTIQQTYNGTTPFSGTTTIYHNSDGTKSFSASAGGAFYSYGSYNSTGNGTWSLPTIPRASSITSAGNVTLGNKCSIKWTPASSTFKYKIKFALGGWSYTTGFVSPATTGAYTYTGYTIPNTAALLDDIPNSTTGTMTATLYTYDSSGTQIGSTSSKTFTVTVPSSVVPTVGTITLTPQTYSYLIQGKNTVKVSVSGCSAGTGSTIKSYTFSGPGISTTTTSTSVTSSVISNTGTLTYTIKVTDNRGRTASQTSTITCYAYSAPSITLDAYRVASSSSTTRDESGTYVRCTCNFTYASVNSNNGVTVKIYYKKATDSKWSPGPALENKTTTSGNCTLSDIDTATTYNVYATITDNYGGNVSSSSITIFGASRILNITSDGTGVAIGKMAESTQQFEVRWPTKLDDTLTVGVSTQDSTPTKGIAIHDVRNVQDNITPDSFGDKNVNFYFTDFGEKDRWKSVVHMKGWSGNTYTAWELAGDAGLSNQNENVLKYRQGIGSTWGAWRTILTEPTVLFSSATGSIGTITLLYSAANYTYLEIYYSDNNNRQPNCVRVFSPNGKYVTLACIEPSTSSEEPRIYIRSSAWTISGTSMTTGRTDLSGANNGVYAQIYPQAGGANTNIDVKVEKNEYIKIFRVLGYS